MGKYDGFKCLSCGQQFTADDDVVVCPDCGTPYHRSCYEKEGKCINIELHESGSSWQPESETAAEGTVDPVRCSRCGQENPPEGLFCNRCGMPLKNISGEPRPFNENTGSDRSGSESAGSENTGMPGGMGGFSQFANPGAMRFDQDSDIDGVKLGDLARYVGKNQFSYLTSFIRFGKFGGKASINFSALLFPQFYFFYRKMNLIGVIYLVLTVVLSVPTVMLLSAAGYLPKIGFVTESLINSNGFSAALNLTSSLLMVMQCLSAVFANYWYYKQARRDIKLLRETDPGSEEDVRTAISRKGGVSMAAFFMSLLIFYALTIGAMFVMNKVSSKNDGSVVSTSADSSSVSSSAESSTAQAESSQTSSGTLLITDNGKVIWNN